MFPHNIKVKICYIKGIFSLSIYFCIRSHIAILSLRIKVKICHFKGIKLIKQVGVPMRLQYNPMPMRCARCRTSHREINPQKGNSRERKVWLVCHYATLPSVIYSYFFLKQFELVRKSSTHSGYITHIRHIRVFVRSNKTQCCWKMAGFHLGGSEMLPDAKILIVLSGYLILGDRYRNQHNKKWLERLWHVNRNPSNHRKYKWWNGPIRTCRKKN